MYKHVKPLLNFIMTKQSVPASQEEEQVFMKDNPIFVTDNREYANILVFAPIHSQRTGALHGVIGYPDNEIKNYYVSMVLGDEPDFTPQVPSTDIGPMNKLVEVNRETWGNELKEYTADCNDVLNLPPVHTDSPFFDYNGALYPFSKEIDFIGGVEGIGNGLVEYGIRFPGDSQIRIPILIYSPNGEISEVSMKQNNNFLTFEKDKYFEEWRGWLGREWYMFESDVIDFDKDLFTNADFEDISSVTLPFSSDEPTTIRLRINGGIVEFYNQ
ncbi:hypothetical protein [Paenibacillus vini]|uniref:Uncharacterized protein n=1 Tax=Paenibacillus vini TaxID=1476024 RepID=A0ABQ4MJ76_9BACL|nr:hypothetical protein [Paenibacillus vini]GIP56044.1 hypothetical protein J42TS3_50790 [Paenibacillus vini]